MYREREREREIFNGKKTYDKPYLVFFASLLEF